MKREELTKTFMVISNWKDPLTFNRADFLKKYIRSDKLFTGMQLRTACLDLRTHKFIFLRNFTCLILSCHAYFSFVIFPWIWQSSYFHNKLLTLKALKYFYTNQFEIIINVLVRSFIWLSMLWVHGHYKYYYSYSAGIDFRREILTTKVDPRTVRFNHTNVRFSVYDDGIISMQVTDLILSLGFLLKDWRPFIKYSNKL